MTKVKVLIADDLAPGAADIFKKDFVRPAAGNRS